MVALLGTATFAVSLRSPVSGWPPPSTASALLPRSQLTNAPRSVEAAHRRLRHRPIDAAAISTLADEDKRVHGVAHSLPLYELAIHRAPRDATMRERLFALLLTAGDHQAALIHLDAWLRLDPLAARSSLETWVATSGKNLLAALGATLADDPPWRLLVWDMLARPDPSGNQRIILEAVAARRTLGMEEATILAGALERDGEGLQGRQIWSRALPDEYQRSLNNVYDGGFDHPDGPAPYGWTTAGDPVGYFVGREHGRPRDGTALAFLFPGREIRFAPIQQAVSVEPGDYQLSVNVNADLEGDADDFAWVISCRAPLGAREPRDEGRRLVSLPIPRQSYGWQRITADVRIDADCPLQLLQFAYVPARSKAPHVSGALAMDELALSLGRAN